MSDEGVSYLFRTNQGSLLFDDVGFGPERTALAHNAAKMGVRMNPVDSFVISHLHPDHMGGIKASRSKCVTLPKRLDYQSGSPVFFQQKQKQRGSNAN